MLSTAHASVQNTAYTLNCFNQQSNSFLIDYVKAVPEQTQVSIKTFIVEDSPTIRENLISTLEEMTDVTTVGFSEGESESVAWLTDGNHAWDLAIVDLFLKQGSGMRVIVACNKRLPHQKLIVLSNYATPDVRQQCLQLGADAVFDKSTEIELLLAFCNQLSQP